MNKLVRYSLYNFLEHFSIILIFMIFAYVQYNSLKIFFNRYFFGFVVFTILINFFWILLELICYRLYHDFFKVVTNAVPIFHSRELVLASDWNRNVIFTVILFVLFILDLGVVGYFFWR